MRCIAFFFALLAALGQSGNGQADQNDSRLDQLFAALQSTEDPRQGDHLGRQIAAIWLESEQALVNNLMDEGRRLITAGDNFEALKRFRRIVLIAPGFAEGWNKRAHVHFLVGDYESAVSDIGRTLDLEPRHFLALAGLGLIYIQLGREDEALKAFDGALAINPHLSGTRRLATQLRTRISGRKI